MQNISNQRNIYKDIFSMLSNMLDATDAVDTKLGAMIVKHKIQTHY